MTAESQRSGRSAPRGGRSSPKSSPGHGTVAATRVTLLGPQRLQPTLRPALDAMGAQGPVATITAGWQERESDDHELHEHLERRSINLALYLRAERAFSRDPELTKAHSLRQSRLRESQDLYNVRLDHAMATAYELLRRPGDSDLLREARAAAIDTIRDIDARHLQRVAAIHTEFEEQWHPAERDSIGRERREIESILRDTAAVAIAGGHVAILLNRLRLFGFGALLQDRTVAAWSAGAMAIADRVVVFHDQPAHGMGNAEVLEVGLGLAPGIVPLPHARHRLNLEDQARVGLFAARFAPAVCVPMNEGARVGVGGTGWLGAPDMQRLLPDGRVGELESA